MTIGPARRRRIARGAAGLLALLAMAEVVTRLELVNPASLPPASTVLLTTGRILLDPEFLANVAGTLLAWTIGMAVAVLVAVPLGLLLSSSARSYRAAIAAVELLRPIPSVALIPLAILLLGRGLDMKVALIAYAATWPILLNTIYGIRDVDPVAKDTARAFGLDRMSTLWHVSLRSATPFIATGVRISAAIALIVAISAELLAGGDRGIGTWMLARSQAGVPRELLYAGIVVAGLLGVALNSLLAAGERRVAGWHERLRQ